MLDAKDSGENGNHFRPLVAKKMFHYAGYLRWYLDSLFQGQVAQMQVAFLVVPGNNFGTRTLFSMVADPRGDLIVGCTGRNERPEIIIIDLGKFQPALIERTIGMVLPFPAC